jgi:hypothetical protein
MTAALGLHVGVRAQLEKGSYGAVGAKDHTAPVASITAVGATLWFVGLVMETDDAISACARDDLDAGFINERHGCLEAATRAAALGGRIRSDDTDDSPATEPVKLHLAGSFREESVITAQADIQSGMHLRSTLTHDDGACPHLLAAKGFDAQPLGRRISPVP